MRRPAALCCVFALAALAGCAPERTQPTPPDATPPLVAIRSPAAGSEVADTVRVDVDASDAGGIRCVTLFVDGAATGFRCQPPWTVEWATAFLPDSSFHALAAEAVDEAGNRALSEERRVCVRRNSPPRVAIRQPETGRWIDLDGPARVWRCDASDPDEGALDGERVVWLVDGAPCAARGREIAPPPLAEGPHAIRVEARDAWGRTASARRDLVAFRYAPATDARGALEAFLAALRARDPGRATGALDPAYRAHFPAAAEASFWDAAVESAAVGALIGPDSLRALVIETVIQPAESFEWAGREWAKVELTPLAAQAVVGCDGRAGVWRVSDSAARVFLVRGDDGQWRIAAWWDLHGATWCSSANPSWSALKRAAREGRLCRGAS